jgi:hypothetical protein
MFAKIKVDIQNFDDYELWSGRIVIPRRKLLDNVGRILGLDLYVKAQK